MATVGLCSYCQTPALTTCSLCGNAVCVDHKASGEPNVCLPCARGASIGEDVNV